MTAAIATSELVKTFGATRALDRLGLTVEAGEVHGFLGPNGAGKSTTIRVLLGLLRADSGHGPRRPDGRQFEIRGLISHPPTLEELMMRHYGDELASVGHGQGAAR